MVMGWPTQPGNLVTSANVPRIVCKRSMQMLGLTALESYRNVPRRVLLFRLELRSNLSAQRCRMRSGAGLTEETDDRQQI